MQPLCRYGGRRPVLEAAQVNSLQNWPNADDTGGEYNLRRNLFLAEPYKVIRM